MSDTQLLHHASLATDELGMFLSEGYDPSGASTSTLLVGPSGVGKSVAVQETAEAIARSLGLEFVVYSDQDAFRILANPEAFFVFVDLRLIGTEPSDIQGIPREVALQPDGRTIPASQADADTVAYSQTYDPFAWVDCLSVSPGVLFLDEITNVQRPDVQSVAYQLALDHLAGFTRFHPGVMIVAAGNDPEESSVANELPAPLINRFTVIRVTPPSVMSWGNWMRTREYPWDKRILAFLTQNESDLLHEAEQVATLSNFPTPRQWTNVARRMQRYGNGARKDAYLAGSLGAAVGAKLSGFLRADVPAIEDLIEDANLYDSLSIDGKYLASAMLTGWLEADSPSDIEADMPAAELKELMGAIGEQLRTCVPLLNRMGECSEEFPMIALGGLDDGYRIPVTAALIGSSPHLADMLSDVAEVAADVSGALE